MSIFTNRKQTVTSATTSNNNSQNVGLMGMGFKINLRALPSHPGMVQPGQQIQPQPQQPLDPALKPMKWGEPTWFLFHTLAHKIKDENFPAMKNELLNTCFTICKNLPCPMCAEHATQYMGRINFNAIQNRDQLKNFFFEFHNTVNLRKGHAVFNRADLDDKYANANTINIILNFMQFYRDKSRSIRNISNDFFRERAITAIYAWLRANAQFFNP